MADKTEEIILTDKQERFVEEFIIDLSIKGAAERSELSYEYCRRLVTKSHILEAIEKAKRARSKRTQVDADWLLNHCAAMLEADAGDIMDEMGALKPIHDWPKIWRQMLNASDVKELYEYNAAGVKEKIGNLIKARFVAREKIIELTGKHVNIGAFRTNVEFTGNIGISFAEGLRNVGEQLKSQPKLLELIEVGLKD